MNELAFFEKYCSHFSNQDVKAIGDCFSGPVTFFLSNGDNYTFVNREEMDKNTEKLFDIYNDIGFSKADFNLLAVITLANAQHLCQLKWTLLDEKANLIVSFETAYLLSGKPENYSITAVYVNNEM
ncbi:MAG: hypothetical protein GY829_13870, partial [Gammaproteobacteria bacterium]|nr:hypothetical protein [Gammaproteobacteria bacterium]